MYRYLKKIQGIKIIYSLNDINKFVYIKSPSHSHSRIKSKCYTNKQQVLYGNDA